MKSFALAIWSEVIVVLVPPRQPAHRPTLSARGFYLLSVVQRIIVSRSRASTINLRVVCLERFLERQTILVGGYLPQLLRDRLQ